MIPSTAARMAALPGGLSASDSAKFTVTPLEFEPGDVNGDGVVRSGDAIVALRISGGLMELTFTLFPTQNDMYNGTRSLIYDQRCFSHGDGKINIHKALAVKTLPKLTQNFTKFKKAIKSLEVKKHPYSSLPDRLK